jgi:ABC-type Fe3+-hydroxamate transport system substrate-binding protein
VTNVETIEDNYYLLKNLGKILGKEDRAQLLILKSMKFSTRQNLKQR